jgi:hypothetical protein
MMYRQTAKASAALAAWMLAAVPAHAQSETFTATAAVKTAGAAAASTPVTIVVDRKMPQSEADKLLAAFRAGGAAGLRKALDGVPPTGSIRVANGSPTPTRLTLERPTEKGRLITIVTDQPVLFLGAGVPGAKPREGYDFAIIDLELDAAGAGTGTFTPAAKVTVKQGVFVVEDYSGEVAKLTGVSRK